MRYVEGLKHFLKQERKKSRGFAFICAVFLQTFSHEMSLLGGMLVLVIFCVISAQINPFIVLRILSESMQIKKIQLEFESFKQKSRFFGINDI